MVREHSNTQKTTALFGAQLRALCATKPSASHVARDLGINRQQFARYLNGTSIPRAGLIDQIARYFDVSVGELFGSGPPQQMTLANILPKDRSDIENLNLLFDAHVSEQELPSGLHQTYKISQTLPDMCVVQLVRVYRSEGKTKVRKVTPISLMAHMPMLSAYRPIHGTFYKYQDQICLIDYDPANDVVTFSSYIKRASFNKRLMSGLQIVPALESIGPPRAALCCIKTSESDTNYLQLAREQGVMKLSELPKDIQYYLGADHSGPYGKIMGIA